MSEWFYISQWRLNALEVWFLFDQETKEFILENVSKSRAEEVLYQMKDKKLLVVNKFETKYNEIINKRGNNEDTFSQRRV